MIYEVNTPLTITGVIATIVSLIFAFAALINSHRRRKHAQNMAAIKGPVAPPPEEVLKKHTQELVRKLTPPPEAAPPPPPTLALRPEPRRQNPVQPQVPTPQSVVVETPAELSSSPLFRKLGLHGLEESARKVDDTQYRWE